MKAKFDLIRKRLAQTFPCAHENADTSLGNGKIWAKCEDCGDTFHQERWDAYRQNAEKHQEALDALDALEAMPPDARVSALEKELLDLKHTHFGMVLKVRAALPPE